MSEDFCRDFASSLALMLLDLHSELRDFAEGVEDYASLPLHGVKEDSDCTHRAASTL